MKKILNEDNQIHNFISSSGSGTVISYDSGSNSDFSKTAEWKYGVTGANNIRFKK